MTKEFVAICFCLFVSFSYTQNHELNLNYRIGVATNSFQIIDPTFENNTYENQYSHRNAVSQYDMGASILYKWKILRKYNLFLTGGGEYSSSKHYKELIDPDDRLLENIRLTTNRFTFHLGLNKQFEFYDSKVILDLGCHIVDRYYTKSSINYSKDFHFNNEDWIEYKYDLTTHHGKYFENNAGIDNKKYMYLNLDFNINLLFEIMKNMYLTFGVNYSRNNVFFYDFKYTINYYNNDSAVPTSTVDFQGLQGNFDPKYGVRDHFFYLDFGVSHKFNWKKE